MAHTIKLSISAGALQGKASAIRFFDGLRIEAGRIVLDGHDVLVFGRSADCGVCLPEDDGAVSRHHFVLEVNPPAARIRDFGSLNGTYVNNRKIGGRAKGQTPEEGGKQLFPSFDLKPGDKIKVGRSVFTLTMESDSVRNECRQQAEADPAGLLSHLLRQTGLAEAYDFSMRSTQTHRMLPEAGQADAASPKPEVPGYEMGDCLGRGACGAVYRAKHQPSGRTVAIKVLLARVVVSAKARNDFLREIKVTKELRHPNVITLLDHGAFGTTFYFIMEYCHRGSLGELAWRRGGKLSPREAAPIMLDALEGLAYCHDHNLVHRDLKPDNLLLAEAPAGRVIAKISDLGLAKNFTTAGLSGMTVTGHFAGTYEYMPREQLTRFKFVDPASDVWSIGATFYHTLTGCLPHDFPPGKDPAKVVLEADVLPVRKRDAAIPKQLAAVIDRSLATQPAERYQDAREMRDAMARAVSACIPGIRG